MASESAQRAYEGVIVSFGEEDEVAVAEDGLLVRGKLFAFLEDDDLVVELPEARARDLVVRGVAAPFRAAGHPTRNWIRVSDLDLWPELARESHEFVGEPPVGGES